eukprot:scaffold241700_cov28-Tisochrysis_lutea.AAC.4
MGGARAVPSTCACAPPTRARYGSKPSPHRVRLAWALVGQRLAAAQEQDARLRVVSVVARSAGRDKNLILYGAGSVDKEDLARRCGLTRADRRVDRWQAPAAIERGRRREEGRPRALARPARPARRRRRARRRRSTHPLHARALPPHVRGGAHASRASVKSVRGCGLLVLPRTPPAPPPRGGAAGAQGGKQRPRVRPALRQHTLRTLPAGQEEGERRRRREGEGYGR